MEQKQRNKIAYGLTALLAPLLIYLLVTNIGKVRKPLPPPLPQEPTALGVPGTEVVPPGVEVQPSKRRLLPTDTNVLAEQKRVAGLLPENNPFNPSRSTIAAPPPITTAPALAPPTVATPPPTPDAGIKLTAILSRGASRAAMINGRFLMEGQRVAGWTIIKVNARDVLLKDGDRQMILRLK